LLRTQHCIFSANAPAKRIPQINEVSDDDDLVFLWSDVLRWQALTEAALDARDSRFDKRAQAVAVFVAERTDALFVDVANDMDWRVGETHATRLWHPCFARTIKLCPQRSGERQFSLTVPNNI
jgi:hypothetical protein